MKRLLAVVLIATLLPSTSLASSSLAKKIHDARVRKERIESQLHDARTRLHTHTVKLYELEADLHKTNEDISEVQGRIANLNGTENSTQRKLDWNTVILHAAEKSLKRHDDAYKHTLVEMYENGDVSYLNVLLSSRSFSDFAERWQDMRLLVDSHQNTLRQRMQDAKRVASTEAALYGEQQMLEQEQQQQHQNEIQLAELAKEKRGLVAVADQVRRGDAVQVAQMEELNAQQEAQLGQYIREQEAEIEAARARSHGTAYSAGNGSCCYWPLHGPITSGYGWRSGVFGGGAEFHHGLDIGVDTGTTVRAAAGGTVIMARWYGGYGNYILIDHGGGISSGYGHLSALYVREGQQVSAGQAIAASGSTGYSTGPHLHFEVRRNGTLVNPNAYLH